MKKIGKKLNISKDTVEAYNMYYGCACECSCQSSAKYVQYSSMRDADYNVDTMNG